MAIFFSPNPKIEEFFFDSLTQINPSWFFSLPSPSLKEMSWFGLGGGKKEEEPKVNSMNIDDFHSSENSFGSAQEYAAPRSMGGGGGGGSSFEQEVMAEQQKAMIQAVMLKLTDAAFESCITKPGSSMSSSEQSCITSVVGKYMEASQLIVGKMHGGQQH